MDNPIKSGQLSSGTPWAITDSRKKAVPVDLGEHHVMIMPTADEGQRRWHEVSDVECVEAFVVAWRHGIELSEGLGRPGYFRLEINGPAAASRDNFHVHIIAGKEGVTFRRSVDSILLEPVSAPPQPTQ